MSSTPRHELVPAPRTPISNRIARATREGVALPVTPTDESRALARRARNAAKPVFTLPTEMLVEVFKHYCDLLQIPSTGWLRWITITHVCAHWRNVALGTPTLWKYIRITERTVDRLDELLSRAGYTQLRNSSMPVDIFSSPRSGQRVSSSGGMLKAYNELICRAVGPDLPASTASSSDRSPATKLQLSTLHISLPIALASDLPCKSISSLRDLMVYLHSDPTSSPSFDNKFITAANFPNLQSLILVKVRAVFGQGMLPNSLTSLTVWDTEVPSLKVMCSDLQALPQLSYLKLGLFRKPVVVAAPVSLPVLLKFQLHATLNSMHLVLNSLTLPEATDMTLMFYREQRGTNMGDLDSAIANFAARSLSTVGQPKHWWIRVLLTEKCPLPCLTITASHDYSKPSTRRCITMGKCVKDGTTPDAASRLRTETKMWDIWEGFHEWFPWQDADNLQSTRTSEGVEIHPRVAQKQTAKPSAVIW